jgi:hypothetical protein
MKKEEKKNNMLYMPVKLSTSKEHEKNIWPMVMDGRTKMDDRSFVRPFGRRNKKKKKTFT